MGYPSHSSNDIEEIEIEEHRHKILDYTKKITALLSWIEYNIQREQTNPTHLSN